MTKYVAFLRAVNVGGRVVKMEELKKMFDMPGIQNISTYIQSGNVLFETAEKSEQAVQKKIETRLLKELGYEVAVFLKTIPEIEKILKEVPFKETEGETEGETEVYVTMLSAHPAKEDVATLEKYKDDGEAYEVVHNIFYLLSPRHTYGKSRLSNAAVEKKLKVKATTRNTKTLNKITKL